MKRCVLLAAVMAMVSVLGVGCSKHDCSLKTEADQKKFGKVAEATSGAHRCMLSNGELVAFHSDSTPDAVAQSYKTKMESFGWTIKMEDYEGKRANGKPFKGKKLHYEVEGKKGLTLVYQLGDSITEAVTVVE